MKLEGDYSAGYALLADAVRPRLGLRWMTPSRRKFDADVTARASLVQEVGKLAAAEADDVSPPVGDWRGSKLYIEPEPPGRDVWVGFSESSGRLLQVIYHAHRREHILAGMVLPTVVDMDAERAMTWAVFDLSCIAPGGMKLTGQRLNVGDLGLTFADRNHEVTVRQIAVAELALKRMPLDGWIADQQKMTSRYHRPIRQMSDAKMRLGSHDLIGRAGRMVRRRRYRLMWRQPANYFTIAMHDQNRDRLVIVHGTDEPLVREMAGSVGTV